MKRRKFPKDFLWGVATSSHQVDGNNKNSDWWAWEQEKGRIANNDKSGLACNHWNLFENDIELMNQLGIKQYRFSVEWARIQTGSKQFDKSVLVRYKNMLSCLIENNIEPLVTLQHFTLPLWISKMGGWENPKIIDYFARYVHEVSSSLGANVKYWVTINEPLLVVAASYIAGIMPPGKKQLKLIVNPIRNMLLSHGKAYEILHENSKKRTMVGVANHITVYQSDKWYHPVENYLTRVVNQLMNWTFIDTIRTGIFEMKFPFQFHIKEACPELKGTQDFIGINYYTREYVKFLLKDPYVELITKGHKNKRSDMNQEIYPEGFATVLDQVNKKCAGLDILITENGVSDAEDSRREKFIRDHLNILHHKLSQGLPIKSYNHWSLMDNFEWHEGFRQRFGLFKTDYKTQERIPRKSASVYSDIIKNGLV